MAGEREFRTDITADPTQFNAEMEAMAQKAMTASQSIQSSMHEAFNQVSNVVGESTKKMNLQFDSMAESVKMVRGAFAAVAAIVAGGAMFGKAINQTAEMTGETVKLSKMLGITTEQASTLRTALGMIGMGTDDYTSAVGKMTMKLREGEGRFNELGIATRGSNKELLSGEDVMQNALKALLQFKEGTDRNLASTEIFGKGWAEVQGLLKVTPAVMEAARKKAEELETTVGPEGAQRALQYKLAMNEVKEMFEAVANRVGQALMPILTQLAEWFSSIGPYAVTAMRGAIGMIAAVFWSLKLTVEAVYHTLAAFAEGAIAIGIYVGQAWRRVLSGDFSGAADAIDTGLGRVEAVWKERTGNILKVAGETDKRIKALFDPAAEQGASPGGNKGGKSYPGKKDPGADKSRIGEWEKDLEAQRDAYDKQMLLQGSFQTVTKAMERDYWQQVLAFKDLSDEEKIVASKKYYAAELEIRKQSFEAEIAGMKERAARYKQGSIERIQLAGEEAAKIGEKYGQASKEYRQALGEMSKTAEERGKQQQQLEEMALERAKESKVAAIELERQALDDAEKLGLIHADKKLGRLKQLKEREYQIELQALNDMAVIHDLDDVAHQQHLDKIAKLKEKHAADMAKIDGQVAAESKKTLDQLLDPIGNAFQKLMDGMIQGTQTWSQAVRKAFMAVGADYLALGVKMATGWAKQKLLETLPTTAPMASAAGGAGATTGAAASGGLFGDAVTLLRGIFYDPAKDVMKTVEKSSTDVIGAVGQNSNSVIGEMGTSMVSWWSHLGDMTSSVFSGIGALFSSTFGGLLSTLGSLGATLWSWAGNIGSSIWGSVQSLGSTLWEWAGNIGSTLGGWISNIGSSIWGSVQSLGSTLWDWAGNIGSTLGGWISNIGSSVFGAVQSFGGWISEAGSTLWNWAGSIGSSLGSWIGSLGNMLSGAVGGIFDGISSAVGGIFNGISGLFGGGAASTAGSAASGAGGIGSWISGLFGGGGSAAGAGWVSAEGGAGYAGGAAIDAAGGAGMLAGLGPFGIALGVAAALGAFDGTHPIMTQQQAAASMGLSMPNYWKMLEDAKLTDSWNSQLMAGANGADFITTGAQLLLVGEAGHERVKVTPAPGGGQSDAPGSLTVQFNGVLDAQSFWDNNQGEIVRVLTNAQRTFSTGLA